MQIKDVSDIVGLDIEMEDGTCFRRYSANNWEGLMGSSWEPVYTQEAYLEALYQAWLLK